MKIYKLQYSDKETAIADLKAKGVYTEIENLDKELVLSYSNGTQAVVEVGQLVKVPATYDEENEQLTDDVYYDGIFYDVMTSEVIDFGSNEVYPTKFAHSFAGCNTI
tara:strand:- start:61 stop:381 length:321 start_codon:yes stop_codon:yes gene_type:complete